MRISNLQLTLAYNQLAPKNTYSFLLYTANQYSIVILNYLR